MTGLRRRADKRSVRAVAQPARKTSEHDIRKYFDTRIGKTMVMVCAGKAYVTDDPDEVVSTILGSCVSACVRDPWSGLGGMNHFMLPDNKSGDWHSGGVGKALRYGNHAMEVLINKIQASGCRRDQMEIKVFGGANVTKGSHLIGSGNVEFIEWYLKNEGLKSQASDLGGTSPRRVNFWPVTGKVMIKRLTRKSDTDIFKGEEELPPRRDLRSDEGSIELFD